MSARDSPDSSSSASASSSSLSFHEISPPTSPIREVSPPTSPHACRLSPDLVERKSPLSTSSSSSDDSPGPRKRRRAVKNFSVSRSTLQRRLYGPDHVSLHENEGSNSGSNNAEGNSSQEPDLQDAAQSAIQSDSDSSSLDEANSGTSSDEEIVATSFDSHESNVAASPDSDESSVLHYSNVTDTVGEVSELCLFQGSELTVDESILRILKVYLKERWTKTSLDSAVKLIKGLLPKSNDLPPSGVMLIQRLKEVAPFQDHVEHSYCSNDDCQLPWPENENICSCGCENKHGLFFEYPIEPQIRYLFEHRGIAKAIDCHKNRPRKDGCISDIQDGTEYIKIKSHQNGEYDLILMLNADGVSLTKSSKQEAWSLLCIVCDVPPSLRSSFMILMGVYVSKDKPKMNKYLKPFVDSLRNIEAQGGVQWIHPQSKESFSSKIACPILCADAPAKAYVLNVKPFSHRYGCNICEQKARKVELTPEEVALNQQLPPRKKKKSNRRLIFQEPAALRNGERMHFQGLLAEERHKSRKGVVGETVACDLPYFDRALCICAEYLHVVCLGVGKYFLNLMLFVKGPWFIGNKMQEIDLFISSIKVPDFIKRLPRGMSDLKFLIGSELRAVLLFYSLPAFQEHLSFEYHQHWMLLVQSIFILLKDFISEDDLKAADIMLRLFVREIHVLYKDDFYTYNVHNLLHLCLLVRRWGNLHFTSAFDFEKFNGFIISHVHGTKHIGKELLKNIKIIQSVKVFESTVNASKINFRNELPDFETCGQPFSSEELSIAENQALTEAHITVFKLYGRIKFKSQYYTSKRQDKNKKRADSFVQFKSEGTDTSQFGHILYFVEDLDKRTVNCLVDMFKIVHTKIIFHEETRVKIKHLIPVTYTGEMAVVSVDSLLTKVLKVGDYLCLRPNSHEVNL